MPKFSSKDFQGMNDALHGALTHLGDFKRGPWWMRCVEFHFGRGNMVPGDHFGWHLHKELQMEAPLSGEIQFSVKKSKTVALKTGEIMVLPPDAPHRWQCTRSGVMLGISLAIVPHADSVVMPLATWLKPSVIKPPFLADLLEIFLREFQSGEGMQEFAPNRLASWIYLIVTQILGSCLEPPSKPQEDSTREVSRSQRVVSKMIRYIDANIDGDLSMSGFEKAIGLGARQIHRLFIDVTGVSCHQYIMDRRLEIARSKLQSDPSLSIKEVAYASGFASPAHFSSRFKSTFGVSPNEYH